MTNGKVYKTVTVEGAKAAVSKFRSAKEKASSRELNSGHNKHSPSVVRLVARLRARRANSARDGPVHNPIVTDAWRQRIPEATILHA